VSPGPKGWLPHPPATGRRCSITSGVIGGISIT
jgi:hypothetical protein